ncbi:MAG: hypothetical protein AAF391_13920, partial [Bacteroidota bacterium]
RQLLLFTLLGLTSLISMAQTEIRKDVFGHLRQGALILSEGTMVSGSEKIEKYTSNFLSANGKIKSYKKSFDISVNQNLDYEIGEIQTANGMFSVMFLKNKPNSTSSTIELLVIYKNDSPSGDLDVLKNRREEWMKLCNSHKANELVKQLYSKEAFYYNRGRLLKGTSAISAEYGYMNSSSYSLQLTPKHIVFVTDDIVFEVGRCSGSYPLPYMLLWEKQTNGEWQVLLDSNY